MSDMSLFIKIGADGKPETFPILEENLKDLIENFDPKNPSEGFVKFVKTPIPELKPYEKYDYMDYERSPELTAEYGQETWHEVHHVRSLNEAEKQEVIDKFKELNPELSDWIYDDVTHNLVPPVPMPQDGKSYFWNTDDKEWQENRVSISPEQIMQIAKELGIDLQEMHGRPEFTEEMMNQILEVAKQQGK
jgi:hypothetical protein